MRGGCALAAVGLLAGTASPAQAGPEEDGVVQVDLGPDGMQPDNWSEARGLSADGRYALFTSLASNLVPGDTNRLYDVFVRDLRTGRTERVSVADDGAQLDASTSTAAISGDGRYVAFASDAPGVVPGQPADGGWKIFVRDRRTGHTELVTTGAGTFESPAISGDGRYVAYTSDRRDIHVTDRREGTTRLVTSGADGSRADNASDDPVIGADGTTVGFRSKATNLLSGDRSTAVAGSKPPPPRRAFPFYVWDARTGRIQGASVDPAGVLRDALPEATLSPDGAYAMFRAFERNETEAGGTHAELYVRDLRRGTTTKAGPPLPGTRTVHDAYRGSMTADSRWVLFGSEADNLVPGDTDQAADLFRRDLRTGRVERIGMTGGGADASWRPNSLSVDGPGTTALFDGTGKVFARRLPPA
ncbi:PD40 domain-containing protein [Streptomyces thioluteus]|uniref:PD40 domain-containing protein n=1 Tax=Streptomyces thioluteus TaxID=66431 RepID=A0ABP6J5C1_STRTU